MIAKGYANDNADNALNQMRNSVCYRIRETMSSLRALKETHIDIDCVFSHRKNRCNPKKFFANN